MVLLDLSLDSIHENLALDEALLLQAEQGLHPEVLRLWEHPRPAVILGSGGVLSEEVHEESCCRDRVPILRRSSGGGTVLLGKGCLLFSLILPYERSPELQHVTSSYQFILERIASIVESTSLEGVSDLGWNGVKISGNSQQRKRNHLLHHGTFLYDFDVSLFARYLKHPNRQPEWRNQRAHSEFVQNVPMSGETLRRRLCEVWEVEEGIQSWPVAEVRRLVSEKYARQAWIRRR